MTFKLMIRIISSDYFMYIRNIEEGFRYIIQNSILNVINEVNTIKRNISINQRRIRLSSRNQVYE